MSELTKRRGKLIAGYTAEARQHKLPELPDTGPRLVAGDKAVVFDQQSGALMVYVHHRGLWRKKLEAGVPGAHAVEFGAGRLTLRYGKDGLAFEESISVASDAEEAETYFVRKVTVSNTGAHAVAFDAGLETAYLPEAPLSDFTYVSYKWMGRKQNLGAYPYPHNDYLSTKANNQLFYNVSGGIYCGVAYLDTGKNWESDLQRDDAFLSHKFHLMEPLAIAAGGVVSFDYLLFAGVGKENHIGHLSNLLWRLNWENDPGIHSPQTDMRDFVEKLAATWERSTLNGNAERDHYSAHFFSDFYDQFADGVRPDDQFGCSWLEYDILKANHYHDLYLQTKDAKYREYAKRIVAFYLHDHYVGKSHLTYPFHTGKFMRDIPPFCEKSGWGAPFEPDRIDSLATAEMIHDALALYAKDKTLFQGDYPGGILDDVLALQQPDGHFRRLYDATLSPVEKIGWVSQHSETQTWIPVLLALWRLTGDQRALDAALRTGERVWQDIEEQGLFAMGGCETDYPDYWDVDGYRTTLWAFIELHDALGDRKWAERAEDVQLFNNTMMLGYNLKPLAGTFYDAIGWKPRGMVATSFYPYPDYARTFCTATGNQSVCWIGLLLLRLYDITSKEIYARRAVAAFRQTMVFRDEDSLAGCRFKDDLLHTIMENNPQLDDESGLYEQDIAQNSTSAFTDLYLYLGEIVNAYGGVSVRLEPSKRHVFGLDCVDVVSCSFGVHEVAMTLRNTLPRAHKTTLKISGLESPCRIDFGGGEVKEYAPRMEISFAANQERRLAVLIP